jgi:glycosyltransferase involved in cell wall biosynthesis
MTDISVIVICKNSATTLARALDSILAQTIQPKEVIVVVAPSVDSTMEILRARKDLLILNQQGKGIGDARNLGISKVRGGFIAFLDADDEWAPYALEMHCTAFEMDPAAMVSVGFLVKVEENAPKAIPEPMAAVTPGGCLFRAEVFSVMGGFDTDVAVAADHKWFMQARLQGVKFVAHQGIVLRKYIHGNNMSVVRRELYRKELISLLRGRK